MESFLSASRDKWVASAYEVGHMFFQLHCLHFHNSQTHMCDGYTLSFFVLSLFDLSMLYIVTYCICAIPPPFLGPHPF